MQIKNILKTERRVVLIIILIKNLFKIYLFPRESLKGLNKEIQARKIRIKCHLVNFQAMKVWTKFIKSKWMNKSNLILKMKTISIWIN